MQRETLELRQFLATLNDEAAAARAGMDALLNTNRSEWPALMAANASWSCYGLLDALLQHAHSLLDSDPLCSYDIVSFVQLYVSRISVGRGANLLVPLLLGTAFKEEANACYATENYPLGLTAIERALHVFENRIEFAVDYGSALLVYAQIKHALDDTADALCALEEAASIFSAHAQHSRYLMTLEVCGQILFDQREYLVAKDIFASAFDVAERSDDQLALVRLNQARGACALHLGDLDSATHFLTRAFIGFRREGMHTAVQRAIVGIARVARERHELAHALEAMHGVYGEFLHRGMPAAAAEILIEVGDIVTEITDDVAYAREMTVRLAESMGAYDVPGSVRDAVQYLNDRTHASTSVACSRQAFAHVREFFTQFSSAPSVVFVAPA
jgi:tetratricopeptide (TPR) repeat protein